MCFGVDCKAFKRISFCGMTKAFITWPHRPRNAQQLSFMSLISGLQSLNSPTILMKRTMWNFSRNATKGNFGLTADLCCVSILRMFRALAGQSLKYRLLSPNSGIYDPLPGTLMKPCPTCGVSHFLLDCKGEPPQAVRKAVPRESGVYALMDAAGRVYVGKSRNIPKRIEQHKATNQFLDRPTLRRVPTLTKGPQNDLETWERNETLAQMRLRGLGRVRGWRYTTGSDEEKQDAFKEVCERFDLCRQCGGKGHFISACLGKSRGGWCRF